MRYAVLLLAALLAASASAALADNAPSSATALNKDMPAATSAAAPASTSTAATPAPAASKFSDADKAAIEAIVKDYLTKEHPEVLVDGLQEMQKRDQASAEAKSEEAVKSASDKIFKDPDTPIGGNPTGDVTVVEFFDYQCGYCKMSQPSVEKLLKDDKGVKFVYKDFPILGPASMQAAKVSLAAAKQGSAKYVKFHDILMNKKDHLNEEMVFAAAKDAGLDVAKLKKDMEDDAVAKQLQSNLDLGSQIGVRGTPMFIVDQQVYPGALQYEQLKKAVDDARTADKGGDKKN